MQYSFDGHNHRAIGQGRVGFVTRFLVKKTFMDQFPIQTVGESYHTEWWIPAERLIDLNANIVGIIEVIAEYRRDDKHD